jgi:hypothetical protein
MAPGDYEIGVCVNGRTISVKTPLAAGETRLVWVSSSGSVVRGASAPVGRKGAGTLDLNGKEINP